MRVNRVRLKNIYQHQDLDIEITGSRVGLVGINGGGKSNFLLAIGEAIHGDFHQVKERVVTWGKDKGEMFVDVSIDNSRRMEITRKFPSGSADMKFFGPDGSTEDITGSTKVNDRILKELGVDKGVLKNIVFVGQKQIDDVLFARDGEKDRLAQRFFGLQNANIIEKAITKTLGTLVTDSFASMLPSLIEQRASIMADIDRMEKELDGLEDPSAIEVSIKNLDEKIRAAGDLNLKIQAYRSVAEARLKIGDQHRVATEEYASAYEAFNSISIDVVNTHLVRERKIQSLQIQITSLSASEKRAVSAQEALAGRPYSEEELKAESNKLGAMQKEVAPFVADEASKLCALSGMRSESVCPTCGQSIDTSKRDEIEKSLQSIQPIIRLKNAEISVLSKRVQEMMSSCSRWDMESRSIAHSIEETRKQKAEAESSLAEIGATMDCVVNPDKWVGIASTYEATRKSLSAQYEGLQKMKKDMDEFDSKISAYSIHVLDGQSIKPFVVIEDLQKELQEKRSGQMRVSGLIATLGEKRRLLAIASDQIEKSRLAETMNKANEEIKRILLETRAAFHPDGAPKMLVARSTKLLEGRINHYLKALRARFVVSAKEGLSFNCHFSNGVAFDTELSVGQKISLSWAFRLAACETFSSSVGLMTMDEPTATLDDESNAAFLDIMDAMRDLADNCGMQFFIATHSESLARACDQVISMNVQQD